VKKLIAVFKREYIQAVRKKMFIVMTILLPLLMSGIIVLPGLMVSQGLGEKHVAVLDATGKLSDAYLDKKDNQNPAANVGSNMKIDYVDRTGDAALEQSAKPYLARFSDKARLLDGVLLVPADAVTNPDARMKYYSRSATDFIVEEKLSSMTNQAVHRIRLAARGVDPNEVDRLMSTLHIDAIQLSKTGQQRKGGTANFIVCFVLTALLFIPSFVYGLEIMRGIIQEKTDRVVEILVSSMTPAQLLVGKILGVAAVGLTQIGVWFLMAAGVIAFVGAGLTFAGTNVTQFLRPSMFVYFTIFFILGYLNFVCVYAIGGAVCNSDKEAQQLIMPITMPMMLPWFLLGGLITNPDSKLAVAFSLAPIFAPMTMFMRTLVADPPMWHIVT